MRLRPQLTSDICEDKLSYKDLDLIWILENIGSGAHWSKLRTTFGFSRTYISIRSIQPAGYLLPSFYTISTERQNLKQRIGNPWYIVIVQYLFMKPSSNIERLHYYIFSIFMYLFNFQEHSDTGNITLFEIN